MGNMTNKVLEKSVPIKRIKQHPDELPLPPGVPSSTENREQNIPSSVQSCVRCQEFQKEVAINEERISELIFENQLLQDVVPDALVPEVPNEETDSVVTFLKTQLDVVTEDCRRLTGLVVTYEDRLAEVTLEKEILASDNAVLRIEISNLQHKQMLRRFHSTVD